MHAHGAALGALRDEDVPHIGHNTFVWHGDNPCGLWAEACRDVAMDDASSTPSAAGAVERGDEDLRVAVDRAALGRGRRAVRGMLAEFPTSLEEDEATLRELANTSRGDEDEADLESAEQFAVAVAYRVSVKRLLGAFLEECLAMGVRPSEW